MPIKKRLLAGWFLSLLTCIQPDFSHSAEVQSNISYDLSPEALQAWAHELDELSDQHLPPGTRVPAAQIFYEALAQLNPKGEPEYREQLRQTGSSR